MATLLLFDLPRLPFSTQFLEYFNDSKQKQVMSVHMLKTQAKLKTKKKNDGFLSCFETDLFVFTMFLYHSSFFLQLK